ncbi:GEM-like protein 4 isoform X3 [Syzygium oleosum]|nr:GEM-like protein 4 isoform X3 [Syzygium oleosum]XP_056170937.1 GEM-like protein 4 isoform X3 [Syzygium oleosum]
MKEQIIGSPLMMRSYESTPERPFSVSEPASVIQSPSSSDGFNSFKIDEEETYPGRQRKFGRKSSSFAFRVRDHVKLGPKLSETVKGKLRLGAKIVQGGGRESIFKQVFRMEEGEEFLKASQCYLSTTAGPIAGLLFISTKKIAFCSERSITFPSPNGKLVRSPYKVLIPTEKIKRANRSENVNNPAQKYIEILTEDDYEFWFMGFLRYEKAFKNLEKAMTVANRM